MPSPAPTPAADLASLLADCERLLAREVKAKQSGNPTALERASKRTSKAYDRYCDAWDAAQRVAS